MPTGTISLNVMEALISKPRVRLNEQGLGFGAGVKHKGCGISGVNRARSHKRGMYKVVTISLDTHNFYTQLRDKKTSQSKYSEYYS